MQNFLRLACLFLLVVGSRAHALSLDDLKRQLDNLGSPANSETKPAATSGAGLSALSNKDQVAGLKQALSQGARTAVKKLAQKNGYLGNDRVRIPLPDKLQKADELLRRFGMGKYGDELITAMNRAAEAAVPEAKSLLVGAVSKMTVSDARTILTGGDDAATQYFRKNTENELAARFTPIVARSMQKVKLAEKYDQFAGKGAKFGLVDERDAKLEDYVTHKALDGLFLMMAEQEKAIRANPLEATGKLARQVFSVLRSQ